MRFARRYLADLISASALFCLVAIFMSAVLIGVDFGQHYDEFYFSDAMRTAIEQFNLFHGHYTYGGLYFVPGFVYLTVDAWPEIQAVRDALAAHPVRPVNLSNLPSAQVLAGTLMDIVDSEAFILEMRIVFASISALTIVWVYMAGRVLFPDSRVTALLGAACVALSWEVGYHARFVAPDTLMMQFAALQLLFLARFARAEHSSSAIAWIMLAAVAGGLGVGVKMTGVFLALPIGLILAFPLGGAAPFDWRGRLALIFATAAAFIGTWVITSSEPLWDALHFTGHLDYEWLNYTQLPEDHPYRVDDIPGRFAVFAMWLGGYLGSPFMVLAFVVAFMAVSGAVVLARSRPSILIALIGFALVYMAFLAQHRGVYVRNLLVLVPFFAICVAAGCRYVIAIALERASVWWGGIAIVVGIMITNTIWLYDAAATIQTTSRETILRDFKDWAEGDADRQLLLSPALVETLGSDVAALLRCDEPGIGVDQAEDLAALFYREQSWRVWQANRPGFFEHVFSSMEINYVFAPSWEGRHVDSRIMVVKRPRLADLKVDATTYRACQVRED